MLINAGISSDKTELLSKKYTELLESGISTSKILVLVQNSIQKNKFLKKVLESSKTEGFETPLIYSFNSLIYNTISDNWALIESSMKGESKILPNLNGLEVTQYILKDILKDIKFKGYNSKKSLLHQIFRRYSLIVQNNLSDDDIKWRAENVLREGFSVDAEVAIHKLLAQTLNLRSLDYIRQSLIFNYIYKHSDYFKEIEYLIIDNADEMTPLCFDFIEYIAKGLKDVCISCDKLGSSRSGYLSADKNIYSKLEKLFNTESMELPCKSNLLADAQTIYSNVINEKYEKLKNFSYISPSKRFTMINLAVKKVLELVNSGVKVSDISIITPVIDDMLKFQLKEAFPKHVANIVYMSGSEKLIQNSLTIYAINILKLASDMKNTLSEYHIRAILNDLLEIPIRFTNEILTNFDTTKELIEHKFENDEYNCKYGKLIEFINELKSSDLCLSEKLLKIYNDFLNINLKTTKEINRFTFCIKQIQDFENVFGAKYINENMEEIVTQLENSIISENPYGVIDLEENDLVISTPQKIIDNEIRTKFQFWLDVSSSEWIKCDTGPLYNAWVFQKDWDKETYTVNDEIELSRQKNAKILRKLTLCADEKIFTYSSLFDSLGVENFGGIEKYINFEKETRNVTFKITPREDQKAIMDYKGGKMAISAVPGAGKTTILLALIIKLLKENVNPENIFVLTYMDSAARNFRERIKNVCQDLTSMPNISTIHGLALKILKDNSNFERLNLPSDFEICDDTRRLNIIQTLSSQEKFKGCKIDDFERAVSILKLSEGSIEAETTNKTVNKFKEFYNDYQAILKEENIIDYDDMLIYSVKLLEENDDILKYYQDICKYIIEDEAQDSSAVQQRLINLLSQKHKNLIRCGDINQAITTTFSNADVEGFRKYITENNAVEMNCSQRCAKEIYTLANDLVKYAQTKPELQNAFHKIFMNPVEGKNPDEKSSIKSTLFANQFEEKNYILKEIRKLLEKNPNATVGILLRTNTQVASWLRTIGDVGLKTISRSECLEQKTVFKVIFAILKIIEKPFDNTTLAQSYEILSQFGYYKTRLHQEIQNSQTPFIEKDVDEITDINLAKFYWNITYWLTFSTLPVDELCIKIGSQYFANEIEKSNVYLISTIIKRLMINSKSYSEVMEKLESLAKKPKIGGFKFFTEEESDDIEFLKGKIQIMTLHKSKGDEFDYVFIPEFSEKSLNLDITELKLKKQSNFVESVKKLNKNYKEKSELELKKEIIEENMRLLYVAITRAKRKLYFTCAKTKSYKGKESPNKPNTIFTELLNTKEAD